MYYFITKHKKVKTNKKHPHHKDAFLHIIDIIYKTSNISLALLSDDQALCEYFGVWVEKSMYGKTYMGIQRATFILDQEGIITHVFEKASPDNNAKDILEVL